MVSKASVAVGSGEGRHDLGAAADGMAPGDEGERAVGDEVARNQNEVRAESIDFMDDALEEEGLCELVEVNIADLDDAVAVEGIGEIC